MLFPRTPKLLRTEPLKALVIGAFVRGLSMRDVESLCEQAGLGKLSRTTASRICEELRERYEAFKRRDLYEIRVVALFLDATFIAARHDGPKEGVLVAWGFTEAGERVLLSVTLGMRESSVGAPLTANAAAFTAPATSTPSCPHANANASSTPTGKHSMTRSAPAMPSSACRRWSTSSTTAATRPQRSASATIWTRSSCTCDTRPATAGGGGQRTCSTAIHFNQLDRQRLKRMRYEGTDQTIPEEVTAA
jgi:hypothetical protein